MPEPVRDVQVAYGYGDVDERPRQPSAREISDMDQALAWLALVPQQHNGGYTRLLVGYRSLVSPRDGHHLRSFRSLAGQMHRNRETLKQWWGQGIDLIVRRLNAPDSSGGPLVGRTEAAVLIALARERARRSAVSGIRTAIFSGT